MGHATGLGPLDTALLLAVDDVVGASGRAIKSQRILHRLYEQTGEDLRDGYRALISLAQPWRLALPLIEGRGNLGTPGNDPPADMQYTESRLTAAGRAAVAAERRAGPPIPFGLVNGSMFRGGERPPFDPIRVAEAISTVAAGGSPSDAVLVLGLPAFPGGSKPTVGANDEEMQHLRRGWPTWLTFESTMREGVSERRRAPAIEIVAFPPYSNWDALVFAMVDQAERGGLESPLRHVQDLTNYERGLTVECVPTPGTSLEELREFLRNVPGVTSTVCAQLSMPAAELLSGWVERHGREAASAGAEALRALAEAGGR